MREHDGPPDHKERALLMADPNPTDRASDDPISPANEDAKVERAVLGFLLNDADLAEIVGHRVETMLARYTHSTGSSFLAVKAAIG